MTIRGDLMTCIPFVALALVIGVPACAPPQSSSSAKPSLYRNLIQGDVLDAQTAADMISSYRRNQGLEPLTLDRTLQNLASEEAEIMAKSGMPRASHNFQNRVTSKGYQEVQAHGTAGYQTLAEAFSGWRESPSHNAALLSKNASRIGIAARYEPGAKYKVYWVLVTARPQ
jgi:uncharacterized protein YkwD